MLLLTYALRIGLSAGVRLGSGWGQGWGLFKDYVSYPLYELVNSP